MGATLCLPGITNYATSQYCDVKVVATPSPGSPFTKPVGYSGTCMYGSNSAFFMAYKNGQPIIYMFYVSSPYPNNIIQIMNMGPSQAAMSYVDLQMSSKSKSATQAYATATTVTYYSSADQTRSGFFYSYTSVETFNISSNTTFCVYPVGEPCSTYSLNVSDDCCVVFLILCRMVDRYSF